LCEHAALGVAFCVDNGEKFVSIYFNGMETCRNSHFYVRVALQWGKIIMCLFEMSEMFEIIG